MNPERLQNISAMEDILNQTEQFTAEAHQFLQKWQSLLPKINTLKQYYYSNAWQEDFEASNRGEIPAEMPHGVLSEDAIYNALGDQHLLALEFLKVVTKLITE